MDDPFAYLDAVPLGVAIAAVFAAGLLEYVCPPLPADTFVLAAGLLIASGRASFASMYLAALAGSTLGAGAQLAAGRALGVARLPRFLGLSDDQAHARFKRAFDRYGLAVIAVNRAFPGVRGVTFIAAGAAGLRPLPVMLAGLGSNLVWTAFLLGVGVWVGADREKILATFFVYRRVLFGLAVGALVLFVLSKVWQRHRRA